MSLHLPIIRSKSKTLDRQTRVGFNMNRVENANDTTVNNRSGLGLHAFVVDSNVHDNYSAFRLNNNIGMGGVSGPSQKRMGFNGEAVNMQEHNNVRNNFPQQPAFHQSPGAISLRESMHSGLMHSHPNFPPSPSQNPLISPKLYYNQGNHSSTRSVGLFRMPSQDFQQSPFSQNPMDLQRVPSHPLSTSQIPKLNLTNLGSQTPHSNLVRYPNSDRAIRSNRSIYQFLDTPSSNPANGLQNSSFSNATFYQTRRIGGGNSSLMGLPNLRSNKFSSNAISAFPTPYMSQNPSIQNIEEEMNILKSVMEGTAFRDNSVGRDMNQSNVLRPLLERSTMGDRTLIMEGKPQPVKHEKPESPKKKKKSKSTSKRRSVKEEEESKVEKTILKKKSSKIQKNVTIVAPENYGKVKLRGLLWTLVYPQMWIKEVDKKVEAKRDEVMNEMDSTGLQLMELVSKLCKSAFDSIYQEKASMVLVSGEEKSIITGAKELSAKDLVKRSKIILDKIELIFDCMERFLTEENLPTSILKILGMLSGQKGVPPQGFYTEFELSRLQFTNAATLKNMPPPRSKLIIGSFIILRTIVYMLLVKPWEYIKTIKKQAHLVKNLKSLSSVLYYIVLDHLRLSAPVIVNNQTLLSVEKKIKPRKGGTFIAFEEELNNEQEKKVNPKEEIIIGMYSRKKLSEFFTTNKEEIEKFQVRLDTWLDTIYELTTRVHDEQRKKEN